MLHNPLQAVATELTQTARGSAVALFALALSLAGHRAASFRRASAVAGSLPMILVEAAIIASLGVLAARFVFVDRKAPKLPLGARTFSDASSQRHGSLLPRGIRRTTDRCCFRR
ncbi:MAG: hypothetical protein H6882_09605 [Rhodobiaceae bacterium]|nr:hypothetical protein [Rhodobiaceae bacterium]